MLKETIEMPQIDQDRHNSNSNIPYENLYIYYLEGCLEPNGVDFGESFIGNWEEEGSSFLFFKTPSDNRIEQLLKQQSHLTLLDSYFMTYEDWQGGPVRPFAAGNFYIVPPWFMSTEKKSVFNEKLKLILDPGVVFGTGTHTTTHDCIEALELACGMEEVGSVLDLGTGTGLLAIAACLLDCKKVLAVDLNFLAVKTAEKNAALNGFNGNIAAVQGRAEEFVGYRADLMIANIHYDVMKELISSVHFLKHKQFILSGLLRTPAQKVEKQLSSLPVSIIKKWNTDGIWHTFLGKILKNDFI